MTPRPIMFTEDGYRIRIAHTHHAARFPLHWSVLSEVTGMIVDSGRATSEEYARHDARTAIRRHKRQLEERAA